ncbi:MAG: hypothetical protein WC678_05230 [Parcubacteria group bacterium]|jgi:hypothetical protein
MQKNGCELKMFFSEKDFKMLEKMKKGHNDPNFTTTVKRALKSQEFIDEKIKKGRVFFCGRTFLGRLFSTFRVTFAK